jgi:hypothetical protein
MIHMISDIFLKIIGEISFKIIKSLVVKKILDFIVIHFFLEYNNGVNFTFSIKHYFYLVCLQFIR